MEEVLSDRYTDPFVIKACSETCKVLVVKVVYGSVLRIKFVESLALVLMIVDISLEMLFLRKGHRHEVLFRRAELKTLVDLHGNEEGKYREALGKWEAALTLAPDVPALHEQKAQVLHEIGESWTALKAARATELKPSWAEVNGVDLTEIQGGEVATTILYSCNSPEFVLQLRLSIKDNHDGTRRFHEANARVLFPF
ncbi:hypothetical protein RYX36_016520 [Vicia faba]